MTSMDVCLTLFRLQSTKGAVDNSLRWNQAEPLGEDTNIGQLSQQMGKSASGELLAW